MRIRPAQPGEAAAITALALRSKAHWGYDEAFMARAATELRWDEGDLRRLVVHVAERDGALLGFSAVDLAGAELEALFVEPAAIGTGVGRALLATACAAARAHGVDSLALDADPEAEAFYVRMGARRVGESRSPSTGRLLARLAIATIGPASRAG